MVKVQSHGPAPLIPRGTVAPAPKQPTRPPEHGQKSMPVREKCVIMSSIQFAHPLKWCPLSGARVHFNSAPGRLLADSTQNELQSRPSSQAMKGVCANLPPARQAPDRLLLLAKHTVKLANTKCQAKICFIAT